MKAPVQAACMVSSRKRVRVRSHAKLIYRAHKEVVPAGVKGADFLASRISLPTKVLLRLVSSEASRLSKANRQKTITLQEISAAVTLVQRKIHTRAAA